MNENYPLQHWLTTLLFAPFLPSIYESIVGPISGEINGLLDIYLISVVFSFVFSLPTFVIYYFVFWSLSKRNISPIAMKFILIILTVIGIISTILLIGGYLAPTAILAYSLATIVSGCISKIKKKKDSKMSQSI